MCRPRIRKHIACVHVLAQRTHCEGMLKTSMGHDCWQGFNSKYMPPGVAAGQQPAQSTCLSRSVPGKQGGQGAAPGGPAADLGPAHLPFFYMRAAAMRTRGRHLAQLQVRGQSAPVGGQLRVVAAAPRLQQRLPRRAQRALPRRPPPPLLGRCPGTGFCQAPLRAPRLIVTSTHRQGYTLRSALSSACLQ